MAKAPSTYTQVEARIAKLEVHQERSQEWLGKLSENVDKLTTVSADITHIREILDKVVDSTDRNRNDLNGLGGRVSELAKAHDVQVNQLSNMRRVLYAIGLSVGSGIAGGVFYITKIFVDYIRPH